MSLVDSPALELFRGVYLEEQPRIIRNLLARFGSPVEDCEDAVQQAGVECLRRKEEWKLDEGILRGMLWRTSIRRRISIARKGRNESDLPMDLPSVTLDPAGGGLTEHSCFQQLGENDQRILINHHVEGLSMREIAELLGKSVDAVKKAAERARTSLRRCLENNGEPFETWI